MLQKCHFTKGESRKQFYFKGHKGPSTFRSFHHKGPSTKGPSKGPSTKDLSTIKVLLPRFYLKGHKDNLSAGNSADTKK